MATYSRTLRLNDGIISVERANLTNFSLVGAYVYTSKGASPKTLNAQDRLQKPDGTLINANATFLEAEVNNQENPPVFSQVVLNTSSAFDGSTPLLIHQYQVMVPFTYPGILSSIEKDYGAGTDYNVSVELEPPVQTEVQSTAFEFLQSSANIASSDFTHDSASGLWFPNQWASIKAIGGVGTIGSAGSNPRSFTFSQDYRGYRIPAESDLTISKSGYDRITFNGRRITGSGQDNDSFIDISVNNVGPTDPIGSKWVLEVDISPVYSLSDGTTIYKKTIIVSDVIPIQSGLAYT